MEERGYQRECLDRINTEMGGKEESEKERDSPERHVARKGKGVGRG